MKIIYIGLSILLCGIRGYSQADTAMASKPDSSTKSIQVFIYKKDTLIFGKVNLLNNLKNVPSDMWQLGKSPFKKEHLVPLSIVAASTGLLIWQDQNVLNGIRNISDKINLDPETNYFNILTVGSTKVLRGPKNLNTALYQLGQGGTSMILAGGLWVYGKFAHDRRAINTAADLTETFITMGLATQVLKRISGRESPFERTVNGGKWRPFPSFSAYQKNTPKYDAFPSGHLSTLVASITVLASNYPEKKWIIPVGSLIASGCAFAMMNTEVHWAGDYPLAIAIGYLSGKITTLRHKKRANGKWFL